MHPIIRRKFVLCKIGYVRAISLEISEEAVARENMTIMAASNQVPPSVDY